MAEPTNTTKLTDVLSFRMNVLSRAIDSNAELNSIRHNNMTLLETRVTHYLYENGETPAIAIARDMCVDAGQISRMIVSLIDKGHAERMPNPADGRSTLISLTKSGRESVSKRIRSVLRWNEILISRLSDEEYRAFNVALDKLTDFVRAPSEEVGTARPSLSATTTASVEPNMERKSGRKARAQSNK